MGGDAFESRGTPERHASLLEELPVNEHGGTIRVELNHTSTEPLPEALRSEANDYRILTVAHNLAAKDSTSPSSPRICRSVSRPRGRA